MKRNILAALIGVCFAAPAFAQSNVTMYGIMDAGVHVMDNGNGTKTKLVSGIADGSRIGFKGTEDLGGGFKAIFNIEARVELDTGNNRAGYLSDEMNLPLVRGLNFAALGPAAAAPLAAAAQGAALQVASAGSTFPGQTQPYVVNQNGALFDRTSMVGLITPVGAVLAGRMYTPGYEILAAADPFETGTAGAWGTLTGGAPGFLAAGVAIRSDKSIQYRIQLPNGVGASVMYGFRNSGYAGLDKKFWGVNVKYKANGADVGVGYNHGTDQNGDRGLISWTVGGSYEIGDMKFFAGYHDMENENSVIIPLLVAGWNTNVAPALAAAAAPFGPIGAQLVNGYTTAFTDAVRANLLLDATSWTVGMHYRVGAGRIMGSVNHVNDRTAFNADATQYSLGYDHNLSKRTDIYTVFTIINNKNSAQYAAGAASAPGGLTSAAGEDAKALQVGIRHRF
jgi:predicted porin